jgi:processive 1,2-diacylglycerol beta-glucosyltransferase
MNMPGQNKKILLLSVSAGAGHMRAAEALCTAAEAHPSGVVATHLDVMNFVPTGFRKVYTDLYIRLVNKHPSVWAYLYNATNEAEPDGLMQRVRKLVERLNTRALHKEIEAQQPDAIICTHFLPAELLSRAIGKGKLRCPVWVQVTDFDLHRMWVQPHMAGYFAANDEIGFRMHAQGIAADTIHVKGIPVMPAFSVQLDRAVCAKEVGLDPDRTTLLLMGGGAGIGSLGAVAEQLLGIEGDLQLIALAGKNVVALKELQLLERQFPKRLVAQGFTDKVERLMACANFAITKPGGLTTSECLATGLPMILNSPIPGQEERNADYLLEQSVALKAIDAVTLEYRVRDLLRHPEKLVAMRLRSTVIGKPHAARDVIEVVLSSV